MILGNLLQFSMPAMMAKQRFEGCRRMDKITPEYEIRDVSSEGFLRRPIHRGFSASVPIGDVLIQVGGADGVIGLIQQNGLFPQSRSASRRAVMSRETTTTLETAAVRAAQHTALPGLDV